MSQQDKIDLLYAVVAIFNDEDIEHAVAQAFAHAVEDNFDIDLSAFLSLVPDFDEDDDDEDGDDGDDDDGYYTFSDFISNLVAQAAAEEVIQRAAASSKGGL